MPSLWDARAVSEPRVRDGFDLSRGAHFSIMRSHNSSTSSSVAPPLRGVDAAVDERGEELMNHGSDGEAARVADTWSGTCLPRTAHRKSQGGDASRRW